MQTAIAYGAGVGWQALEGVLGGGGSSVHTLVPEQKTVTGLGIRRRVAFLVNERKNGNESATVKSTLP